MQKRHTDRKMYFHDLEITSKEFYISYLSTFKELTSKSRILEVGCGEGGNLVPFAQLGCKVTGIDMAKTEHSHPLGMVVSTHFRCGKGVKRGLKNGALPFTID